MLVSFYFLIGRRICRRFFILFGLFLSAVGIYVITALLYLKVSGNGSVTKKPPMCIRPQLDDDDFSSVPDVPKPLHCQDDLDWIDPSNGTFRITKAARQRYGDIMCEYIAILRGKDDFKIVKAEPVKPMQDGAPLTSDFFEARCVGSDGAVHVGLYSNIVADPAVLERCQNGNSGDKVEDGHLDILIFGFDSVSRTSWLRRLPRSHEFMVNDLNGHVFTGYNIVGDGTPQALLPLLTGKKETELPEARRGFDGATTVDEHPWIWRQLKKLDFVTQWAEDSAEVGT